MKCIALAGSKDLRRLLIDNLAKLPEIVVGVLETTDDGISILFPGRECRDVMQTMQPDVLVTQMEMGLAAPVVLCGDQGEPGPLTMARFTAGSPPGFAAELIDLTFPMLPQHTSEECGRCGMDCMGLARRIVAGLSTIDECRVISIPRGVRVRSDAREMELGEFPAGIVNGTVRGLLSSLKGYRPGSSVIVELGPEKRDE